MNARTDINCDTPKTLLVQVSSQCDCNKVLVVDDNEMNVLLMQSLLERLNIKSDTVITIIYSYRLIMESKPYKEYNLY